MSVSMVDNLDIRKRAPNVARDLFTTFEEMKNYDLNYLGDMHISSCLEDGKIYVYNVKNTVDATTGKWRRLDTLINTGGSLGEGSVVTDSTTNGNIQVDGNELNVYDDSEVRQSVEDMNTDVENILTALGELDELTTTEKTNFVDAINEVISNIPDLSEVTSQIGMLEKLTTEDKTNLVNAINEVASKGDNSSNLQIEYVDEIIFEGSTGTIRMVWQCTITGEANTIIPKGTITKGSGTDAYYIWDDITIGSDGTGTGLLAVEKSTSGNLSYDFTVNESTYTLVAPDSNRRAIYTEFLKPITDYDFIAILPEYTSWYFGTMYPVKQIVALIDEFGGATFNIQGYNSDNTVYAYIQRNITTNNFAIGNGYASFRVYGIKTKVIC